MVSASLIEACISETDPAVLELAQQLASSGFRDTSRVGGGNPELGVMMAQYNRVCLLRSLVSYRHSLDQIIELLEQEDWKTLEKKLQQTQLNRPQFLPAVNHSNPCPPH
jgi:arogenate dehydrogenase (NADP+)